MSTSGDASRDGAVSLKRAATMMQVVFEHGRLARDGLSLSRDSLVSGAFRRFDHDHSLSQSGETTVMRAVFDFESPPDILGRPSKHSLSHPLHATLSRHAQRAYEGHRRDGPVDEIPAKDLTSR